VPDCRSFECLDCGVNTLHTDEYYMIHDELWLRVNPKRKGMMCIGCVEARLERELTPEDFTAAPINGESFWLKSARLLSRVTGLPEQTLRLPIGVSLDD